jgi:hypothetical protein
MGHRRGALVAVLAGAGVALTACQRTDTPSIPAVTPAFAPASAATASTAPAGHRIVIPARVGADTPELRITVVADAPPGPDGVLRVRAIEIRRADGAGPAQRIDALATETPWPDATPGLELLDMNFDGLADMRLIEARPAGPNTPYLNWLYEPASGQFVASPALNELSAPRFDAARREIVSDWRDGAARAGTDVFGFRDGQLVPLRRETRDYRRPGAYTLTAWRWAGQWQATQTREVRER